MDWLDISQYFFITETRLRQISREFKGELEAALSGHPSSLCALKSYLGLPTGQEKGTYLALDFGGTNVRVSKVRLLGNGCFVIEKKVAKPLRLAGEYDYMSADTSVEELFDFIATIAGKAAGGNKPYALGHTFSFAAKQIDASDAEFVSWSKEMAVTGMEGRRVNDVLRQALVRQGFDQIRPVALLNDTTAALLAGRYQYDTADVGIICGTGFNVCYYEPAWGMIVNTEAGGYDRIAQTPWDAIVDKESLRPGDHKLEKLLSGAYLSEIYRQTLLTYFDATDLPRFTTKEMNQILQTDSASQGRFFMGSLWDRIIALNDVQNVRNLAAAIFARSAQLTGVVCYGVLRHLTPEGALPPQTIATEGSVFAHVRGTLLMVQDALLECNGNTRKSDASPVEMVLVQDGPTIGAAIAAAMMAEK